MPKENFEGNPNPDNLLSKETPPEESTSQVDLKTKLEPDAWLDPDDDEVTNPNIQWRIRPPRR